MSMNICHLLVDVNKPEPEYSQPLDGERDEGKCIARYNTCLYYVLCIICVYVMYVFMAIEMSKFIPCTSIYTSNVRVYTQYSNTLYSTNI